MNKGIIFGLGGCGLNFINDILSKNNDNYKLVRISNLEKVDISKDINKIILDSNTTEKVVNISKSYSEIYIVSGLGGSSSEYLISLIEKLITKNIKINIICNIPFSWEGQKRNNLSNNIIDKLKTYDIKLKVFDNNEIQKNISDDNTVKEVFKIQSEVIYKYILNDK